MRPDLFLDKFYLLFEPGPLGLLEAELCAFVTIYSGNYCSSQSASSAPPPSSRDSESSRTFRLYLKLSCFKEGDAPKICG